MDNSFIVMEEKKDFVIDLLYPPTVGECRQFDIRKSFFEQIDGMIDDGCVHTEVVYQGCVGGQFRFSVHSEGTVIVPCDRCLADVELRVDTTDELNVKLGTEYSDDGECVVVPESDGRLDISLLIYEFIVLSMPLQRMHEPGGCDVAVMEKLNEHQVAQSNQESDAEAMESDGTDARSENGDETIADERWSALKKLLNN